MSGNNLSLVLNSVEAGTVTQLGKSFITLQLQAKYSAKRTNHTILLLDCSGSMANHIHDVKDDSIEYVESFGATDFVSVIIFSGHGQSALIAGPTQCNKLGKEMVVAAIRNKVRVLGTTVFSEPLEKTLDTVKGLMSVDTVHTVVLFTDGYAVPTEWSTNTEEVKSIAVARKLYEAGCIVSAIGYGPHYNETFIRKLMQASGNAGQFRHISEIGNFKNVINAIRDVFNRTTPIDFDLTVKPSKGNVGRVFRTTPQLLAIGENGKAIGRGALDGELTLYVEVDADNLGSVTLSGTVNGKPYSATVATAKVSQERARDYVMVLGAYASLSGSREEAIELLNLAGEDFLADQAGNNYTTRESRETSDTFRQMFVDRKFIGSGLKKAGPNHCVLNVLRVLVEDKANVVFIPKGAYKRTGELTSDPRVIHPLMGRTLKVVEVQSKEDRFNFSFKALKDVKVKPANEVGEIIDDAEPVDAKVWQNYVIILDGNLHSPDLEASLSEESFDSLKEAGVIEANKTYAPAKVYAINLRNLRMISPTWANPVTLGLVNLMKEEITLEAEQKALNTHLKSFPATPKPEFDGGNVYLQKSIKVDGVPKEVYLANVCEYRLMKWKALAQDISYLTQPDAEVKVKEVRRRLRAVRYLKRAIIFAMESVGSQSIAWDTGKTNAHGTLEQLATFQGETLKRATSTEEVVCS